MKFKPGRTDRLSPEEREIVDRFERGVIDAAEAGRLLIASVRSAHQDAAASAGESATVTEERVTEEPVTEETDAVPGETPEEAKARALIESIAREVYDDPA